MILPNIETALKIHVTKHNDQFRADPTTLPGSPICGTGNTEDAVKYNLCVNYLYLIANYYSWRRLRLCPNHYQTSTRKLLGVKS